VLLQVCRNALGAAELADAGASPFEPDDFVAVWTGLENSFALDTLVAVWTGCALETEGKVVAALYFLTVTGFPDTLATVRLIFSSVPVLTGTGSAMIVRNDSGEFEATL
jgi:hypothetical protein